MSDNKMCIRDSFMPLAAVFYFSSVKGTGVDPIMFYKWTAFSYTPVSYTHLDVYKRQDLQLNGRCGKC